MTPTKRNPLWSAKGATLGFCVGLVSGVLAGFVPVFHWEMAGLFLIPFTTFGGLVAGGFGAPRGLLVGGLAGSLCLGTLWGMFSLTASLPPDNPWAIPISGTVAVVLASFSAAVIANGTFRVEGLRDVPDAWDTNGKDAT